LNLYKTSFCFDTTKSNSKLIFYLKKEKNKVKKYKHKLLLKQILVTLYDTYRKKQEAAK